VPSLWHAAEVVLSPWPRRRRSGPPPWLGCRRAHACARTHTRNHAGACLERSRPSLWLPFAPDLVSTPSRHGTQLCRRWKSFLPGNASANSIPFLHTRTGARARQPGRRQESPVLDRDSLFARRCPSPRSALSLSTITAPDCSLSPLAFCSRTPAPAGVEPYSPRPNGARACSRARTPSQAS
jgi:hypothetical protein